MAHEVSASSTTSPVPGQRSRQPVSPHAAADDAGPGDSAAGAALARPVPFDRLLTVAVLTPAQAAFLASALLTAAADSRGAGQHEDPNEDLRGARVGPVRLSTSGEVEIDEPPTPGAGREVNDLLQELLQNARRLPSHPRPDQVTLLRRLEEVTGDPLLDPAARAHALDQALAVTLGPDARARVVGELSVLVAAFAHVAPGVPSSHRPDEAPLPIVRPASTSRVHGRTPDRQTDAEDRRAVPRRRRDVGRRHRLRPALVVALVGALVLAGGGYFLLNGPGSGLIESLGGGPKANSSAEKPSGQQQHQAKQQPAIHPRRTVPTVAKHSAGRIRQVVVRKTGRCRPGSQCPVQVTVHLRPGSTAQAVGWKVGAARLCRQKIVWSPGRTVTAQAGWSRVFASSSVRVPRGRSLALVALSTTPARAQSRPVPVTGPLHC